MSLNVPFLDLRDQNRWLSPVFNRIVSECQFILGPNVELFETAWAKFCKTQYCVGVDNGLEALTIALKASGIGPGDEVIVPSHTYVATWLAISHAGATIVAVEPKPGKFVIDIDDISGWVTSKTKAIIPVHLYGQVCDMYSIMEMADHYGILVIEDAAQSHGIPMLGHVACYSFYPTKNLGACGDAGAIVTNNKEIADKARLLRNYGAPEKDVYLIKGYNARLDELQAAILLDKLPNLEKWNEKRKQQVIQYDKYLDFDGKPEIHNGVWHQYVIKHQNRDKLKAKLEEAGIGTRIHYPTPPHHQICYSECSTWSLPVAENYAKTVLSLPLGHDFNVESVSKEVNKAVYTSRK